MGNFKSGCRNVYESLHTLSVNYGGNPIPHPFGPALHGTMPNALVQFDYIELVHGDNGAKFAPTVRGDHFKYCRLFPFGDTKAENTLMR